MAFTWTNNISKDVDITYATLAEIRDNINGIKDNEANITYNSGDNASADSAVDNDEHYGYDSALDTTINDSERGTYYNTADSGWCSSNHGTV